MTKKMMLSLIMELVKPTTNLFMRDNLSTLNLSIKMLMMNSRRIIKKSKSKKRMNKLNLNIMLAMLHYFKSQFIQMLKIMTRIMMLYNMYKMMQIKKVVLNEEKKSRND